MKTNTKKRTFLQVGLILLLAVWLTGCGSNKYIDGVDYETHGLFNKEESKNPDIQYKLVWGNIIWGALLCETIVAPIYFYGFSMWEPVRKKPANIIKGEVLK